MSSPTTIPEGVLAYSCKNLVGVLKFAYDEVKKTKEKQGGEAKMINVLKSPKLLNTVLGDTSNIVWHEWNSGSDDIPLGRPVVNALLEGFEHDSCFFKKIHQIEKLIVGYIVDEIKRNLSQYQVLGIFDDPSNFDTVLLNLINIIVTKEIIPGDKENSVETRSECGDHCEIVPPGEPLIV